MKKILTIILAISLMVIAIVIRFESSPVPKKRVSELKVGQTGETVRKILGEPTDVFSDDAVWVYSQKFSWPMFKVYFTPEGELLNWELDK